MKIIGMTLIKNEERRFLKDWLKNNKEIIDLHIFLDNESSDDTVKIIKEFSKKNNYKTIIISSGEDFKKNEHVLRKILWDEVRKFAKDGDWILAIDADEFANKNHINHLKKYYFNNNLIEAFSFNLLDMWEDSKYRSDGLWSPSKFTVLYKYKNEEFTKKVKKGIHCGRNPDYLYSLKPKTIHTSFSIKHMSYLNKEYREEKNKFYLSNVNEKNINYDHALSILSNDVELKESEVNYNKKVVINSLIHNREWLLSIFLNNLENIDYDFKNIVFYFIINNSSDETYRIVDLFKNKVSKKGAKIFIETYNFINNDCGDHHFDNSLLEQMAIMRNKALEYSKKENADYLLSLDTDILVPPFLLKQLIFRSRDIISPVFYSRWGHNNPLNFPQVTPYNSSSNYDFYRRFTKDIKVDFLGAATLIDIKKINDNINYFSWENNKLWGEDKSFCTKASINGLELYCDCTFDLIHIDSKTDYDFYIKKGVLNKDGFFGDFDWKRNYKYYFSNKKYRIILIRIKMLIYRFFSLWWDLIKKTITFKI